MLDCQLYGLKPAGHHLTNVLLHAATAVLLFLVLLRMTAQRAVPGTDRRLVAAQASGVRAAPAGPSATNAELWPSAWVAAVFAIHPLHVESVAWVAERRDMLSGLFFMLTLGAYARYAERPSLARNLAVILFFVLGLMSKSMSSRFHLSCCCSTIGRWAALAGACRLGGWCGKRPRCSPSRRRAASLSCRFIRQISPQPGRSTLPLSVRLANVLVSYAAYVGQTFWPINMIPYYPFRLRRAHGWVVGSLVMLVAITAIALYCWRSRPYLLCRLAVVCGNARAGQRHRAGRRYWPCPGRPLHLSESDWPGDRRGLDRVERLSVTTISAPGPLAAMDARRPVRRGAARSCRRRRASDQVSGAMMKPYGLTWSSATRRIRWVW